MSLLKANAVQLGQSPTATNNFVLYQPASPDGTVRLGNGNSGSVTDLITVGSTGNLTFTGTTETYTNSVTISAASTRTLTLNGGGGTNGLVLDASNNVGIGVSPSYKLDVLSSATGVVKFSASGAKPGWLYSDSAGIALSDTADFTKNGLYINNTSNYVAVYTGSTGAERMRLDSSGSLGVNNSSPSSFGKLAVFSTNVAQTAYTGQTAFVASTDSMAINLGGSIAFGGSYTGTSQTIFAAISGRKETGTDADVAGYLAFATRAAFSAPAERARIDSSGNLLVGTTSTSGDKTNTKKIIGGSFATAINAFGAVTASTNYDWTGIPNANYLLSITSAGTYHRQTIAVITAFDSADNSVAILTQSGYGAAITLSLVSVTGSTFTIRCSWANNMDSAILSLTRL